MSCKWEGLNKRSGMRAGPKRLLLRAPIEICAKLLVKGWHSIDLVLLAILCFAVPYALWH